MEMELMYWFIISYLGKRKTLQESFLIKLLAYIRLF